MELERLRKEWVRREGNVDTQIAAWESTAEDYIFDANTTFEHDPFLRFIERKVDLTKDMLTLDVGCGAGAYSVALAERVGKADGCDLTPKMIELGRAYASERGIDNLELWVENWHEGDVSRLKGAYDLVFAHTTPAVCDLETLEKMISCSRKHCFLSTCARRRDLVYDECLRLAGVNRTTYDDDIVLTFNALWALGYSPEMGYDLHVWKSQRSVDDTLEWFCNRLASYRDPGEEALDRIRTYVASLADDDGMVHEEIETTLVHYYWQV